MSELISHGEPCDDCGSSDAKAIYDDSTYCFSCKKYRSTAKRLKSTIVNEAPQSIGGAELPADLSYALPDYMKAYLYKYYFTDALIEKSRIGYSPTTPIYSKRLQQWFEAGERLILPDTKNEFWEARGFKPDEQKYYTVGGKQQIYIPRGCYTCPTLVVVEDMLSAIRVNEIVPAVALRGTGFNLDKVLSILNLCKGQVVVWLDGDKAGLTASVNLAQKLSWVADHVQAISTDRDPKCYSNNEITAILFDREE